jgi:hypothetical protein
MGAEPGPGPGTEPGGRAGARTGDGAGDGAGDGREHAQQKGEREVRSAAKNHSLSQASPFEIVMFGSTRRVVRSALTT